MINLGIKGNITNMINDQDTLVNEASLQQESAPTESSRKRGRPRVEVQWPNDSFTFASLVSSNVLSTSSLRKKMRAELEQGGLVKVDTLKTAFGRPLNVYRKV